MSQPSIVWFRDDLRLADNPALRAAIDRGEPVIGLYVLDEESPGIRPLGGAAKWWLHGSLVSLGERLAERGSTLVMRRGPAASVVADVVKEASAGAVFWNRRYGGAERDVDAALKTSLREGGLDGRVIRRVAAVRAVDRPDRSGHAVLRVHAVLAGLSGDADAARAAARAALDPGCQVGAAQRRPGRVAAAADGSGLGGRAARGVGAGRAGGPGAPARVSHRRSRRLRPRARRTVGGSDLGPVAAPPVGRDQPVHGVARDRGVRQEGRTVPVGARMARIRRARAVPPPRPRDEEPASRVRRVPLAPPAPFAAGGVAARAHRHPARGCRHAGAVADRSDAQPHPDGDGILPHQEPAHRLAARRGVVLGHARGRGRSQQPVQLAVGGRVGGGCRAVLPGLQPRAAGQEVRPALRVHPALGARVRRRHRRARAAADRRPRRDAQGGAGRVRADAAARPR